MWPTLRAIGVSKLHLWKCLRGGLSKGVTLTLLSYAELLGVTRSLWLLSSPGPGTLFFLLFLLSNISLSELYMLIMHCHYEKAQTYQGKKCIKHETIELVVGERFRGYWCSCFGLLQNPFMEELSRQN